MVTNDETERYTEVTQGTGPQERPKSGDYGNLRLLQSPLHRLARAERATIEKLKLQSNATPQT